MALVQKKKEEIEQFHCSSTSRQVERMFSLSKLLLARNSSTRIELLNALLCLKNQNEKELKDIWLMYHYEDGHKAAKQILKQSEKKSEKDFKYLEKLKKKEKEKEVQEQKLQRKQTIAKSFGTRRIQES